MKPSCLGSVLNAFNSRSLSRLFPYSQFFVEAGHANARPEWDPPLVDGFSSQKYGRRYLEIVHARAILNARLNT